MVMTCALMWCSLFCFNGDSASSRVMSIGDAVYNMNWYEHPLEIQQFITLIMLRSQKEISFSGVRVVHCTLEVFGIVKFFPIIRMESSCLNNISFFVYSSANRPALITRSFEDFQRLNIFMQNHFFFINQYNFLG